MYKIIFSLVVVFVCLNAEATTKYCWRENGNMKYSYIPREGSTLEQREQQQANCKRRGMSQTAESAEMTGPKPIPNAPVSPAIANLPATINSDVYNDASQKELDAQYQKQEQQTKQQNAQYCKNMREQLAQLRNVSRLTVTEPNGEIRRIGEEERQAKIADAERNISDNCLN